MVKKKSVDLKFINRLEWGKSHKHYTNSFQELPLHNLDSIDRECVLGKGFIFRGRTKRSVGEKMHPKERA